MQIFIKEIKALKGTNFSVNSEFEFFPTLFWNTLVYMSILKTTGCEGLSGTKRNKNQFQVIII